MRTRLWQKNVRHFVIPRLPGTWATSGAIVYRTPPTWFLGSIVMSGLRTPEHFKVSAVVQFLAVPNKMLTATTSRPIGHHDRYTIWDAPADEVSQQTMQELTALLLSQAIPFIDRHTDLAVHIETVEEAITRNPVDPCPREELCYARLLAGDIDGAVIAAQGAAAASQAVDEAWAQDLAARVTVVAEQARRDPALAVETLHRQAAVTRQALRLT